MCVEKMMFLGMIPRNFLWFATLIVNPKDARVGTTFPHGCLICYVRSSMLYLILAITILIHTTTFITSLTFIVVDGVYLTLSSPCLRGLQLPFTTLHMLQFSFWSLKSIIIVDLGLLLLPGMPKLQRSMHLQSHPKSKANPRELWTQCLSIDSFVLCMYAHTIVQCICCSCAHNFYIDATFFISSLAGLLGFEILVALLQPLFGYNSKGTTALAWW